MARIVNVIDSYDAMTSDRGDNKVKDKENAIKEIENCKGGQFDSEIADLLIGILKSDLQIIN